ncbi:MAG: hypothetical protein BHW56_08500 [Acetobacter sp. 46_36]|nr:MAG: hypothetical protein BHW56_08500 [Acetobacter sp. 46_36]
MSIQRCMTWFYKDKEGKNINIDDFLANLDRGKSLVILKIIENIEEKFKLSLSESELQTLTSILENNDEGELKISLLGNKDIISKIAESDSRTTK